MNCETGSYSEVMQFALRRNVAVFNFPYQRGYVVDQSRTKCFVS